MTAVAGRFYLAVAGKLINSNCSKKKKKKKGIFFQLILKQEQWKKGLKYALDGYIHKIKLKDWG